ncbi:SemiSWEET family sugar transporter [Spiroplasma endosymbiont of Colias croceus]|uniref:SemiSWEET family sugar transporter n=1 Tax=Spiroplasma endosymbiont of Colias croceus TaxID=3066310 RepID=UPI0030D190B8
MSNIAIDIIGYIGAFFISVVFLPQTIKLIKTKNTKGLSLISYSIYQIGLTSFIIYASLIKNIPLLAANAFGYSY